MRIQHGKLQSCIHVGALKPADHRSSLAMSANSNSKDRGEYLRPVVEPVPIEVYARERDTEVRNGKRSSKQNPPIKPQGPD